MSTNPLNLPWVAIPKNDRLQRWMILGSAPGTGKPVIAENLRTREVAEAIVKAMGPEPAGSHPVKVFYKKQNDCPDLVVSATDFDAIVAERETLKLKMSRITDALHRMKQTEPANHNGDLFYPRYTPDGDYAGEEYVNPLALIGDLYTMINDALFEVEAPTDAEK